MLGLTAAKNMFRRRMWLMTAGSAAVAVLTFAIIMLQPRVYTATSMLILNQPAATATAQISPIDAEVALLRSPALMGELATALGMQAGGAETPGLAEDLASAITVEPRAESGIIEIRAHAATAQRAQLLANTYADVYIASQVNMSAAGAMSENSWLSRRLAELREDVQTKEDALNAFRLESGLGTPDDVVVPETQGDNVQASLQSAQSELAEREARLRQLNDLRSSGADIDALANVVNSATISSLREREADINRRQQDLENRYLPTHPAVQAIQQERRDLDSQIEREVQRFQSSMEAEVARARSRVQALQQQRRAVAAPAPTPVNTGNAQQRLHDLEQQAQEARALYESFLQRYQNSADQSQMSAPTTRLLSGASLPAQPSSPQLRFALLLALAAGLLFGVGAGLIAELFDQSVKNGDDLEAKVGVAAISSIPTISKRMMRQMPPAERHPSGYLVGRPMSAFTESLRVLRTVIVYSKLDLSSKVVAVTSALPDEGKTTISMCLARVAAMSGQKVCVVDCDLRKQSINDVIDIETDVGILQVLAGEAPWRSAIVKDPNSDAHVLPIAASGFTPRDVFGSDAMGNLISELREHYDLVILDCAPILAVAETRIVVGRADTTVLIARAGRTHIGAMRAAVAQTEAAGGNILGIALNYVLPRWQSYSDSLYFNESKSYYSVS
ncbi:MAG: AAA family ATPase [Alphaproteobacteria bacterium]|nr:AAA family ATPase [Alphaproteobacteria bacterium]